MATSKFVIIGAHDNPVYEVDFLAQPKETPHFGQFILHSSLDLIDELKWKTKDMFVSKKQRPFSPPFPKKLNTPHARRFLKKVDAFGKYHIVAWVTSTNAKFVLLTEKPDLEPCRAFFTEVYELYLKTLLNPFYAPSTVIVSPLFDAKIKKLGQKYFSF